MDDILHDEIVCVAILRNVVQFFELRKEKTMEELSEYRHSVDVAISYMPKLVHIAEATVLDVIRDYVHELPSEVRQKTKVPNKVDLLEFVSICWSHTKKNSELETVMREFEKIFLPKIS
eukprot:gene3728-7410_t